MRKRLLILQFALGLAASAQIGPPSLGVAGGAGRRPFEIQGIPGAWVARPALTGPTDAAASSALQLCWASGGTLHIQDRRSGRVATYPVPEGDARFAFDGQGRLAAAWFLKTGEVLTSAAGWSTVYVGTRSSEPLDLTAAQPRILVLLCRSESGLYRARIDAATGRVLSETKLEDLTGPALLDSGTGAVFAANSGIPGVKAMRRVEQGWILLSTAHGEWVWQPGKQPQGVPLAANTGALQLWPPDGNKDVGDGIVLPDTPVGSTTQVEYVLSNQGASDIYLSTLHLITVAPFRLTGAPHPPWRIGAGLLQAFFVNFSPTEVGAAPPSSLTIDYCYASDFDSANNVCPEKAVVERSVSLTGTGVAAPESGPWLTGISPESNMAGAPAFTMFVNGGGFTPLSAVQWNGTPLATTFVSSAQLSAAVPANLLVNPADTSVTVANPPGGSANTTKVWTFHVYSTLTPSIALFDQNDVPLSAAQLRSNMTVRVRLKLDQAPTTSLSGVLELGFQAASSSIGGDPSIALGSPGSSQQVGAVQTFTVPAGATMALFGNADYVAMTTGTTAGTITLALDLQNALPVSPENYVIPPVPPVILSSSKVFTAGSTVLTIQGYDNTHSASSISFTFYTSSGAVVSPGTMTVDVTKDFANYFQTNSQIGGSFVLTATFPVSGDISQIASVNTALKNDAGTATAKQ